MPPTGRLNVDSVGGMNSLSRSADSPHATAVGGGAEGFEEEACRADSRCQPVAILGSVNQQPGWERKKAQTRAALATTAAEMFRERGFDGVTAAEIAKAAGTSERTFFRYFETKEDVLFLDIREILDGL